MFEIFKHNPRFKSITNLQRYMSFNLMRHYHYNENGIHSHNSDGNII